jgi:hypothetical protein
MINEFEIGKPYLPVVGREQGIIFGVDKGGLTIVYNFENPSKHEIDQVRSGKSFEIRAAELNDVVMVTTKLGDLKWTDAPYNPRLSGEFALEPIENDTAGYALYIFMTDTPSGIIKHMRLIGLGNKFSKGFRQLLYKNLEKDISVEDYDRRLSEVFDRYDTKKIVEYSSLRYKLKEAGE